MIERTWLVYCHENKINQKKYFGISCQRAEDRWKNGLGYNPYNRGTSYFYRSIQKYGWDGFNHIVLFEGLEREVACEIEIFLIDKFKTTNVNNGYNVALGGDLGGYGVIVSEETRLKMSKTRKGTRLGEEHHFYGKHHTEEARKKMSEKVIQSNIRRGHGPRTGIKFNEESRLKISKSNSSSVTQLTLDGEFVNEFYGANEAQRQTGIVRTAINSCCSGRGNSKTAGGYVWMYTKDYKEYGFIKPEKRNKKEVLQFDKDENLIQIWESASMAERSGLYSQSKISLCCNGKRKRHKGYIWKFSKDVDLKDEINVLYNKE